MKISYDVQARNKDDEDFSSCGYDNLETVEAARNTIKYLRNHRFTYRIVKVTREVVK